MDTAKEASQAEADQSRVWNHAIEMEDHDYALEIQAEHEVSQRSTTVQAVGGAALQGKPRNFWMSSAQLAADAVDYWDF